VDNLFERLVRYSLTIVAGMVTLSSLALAQGAGPQSSSATAGDTPAGQVRSAELAGFERFLDEHPRVATELHQNPSLINDPNYLNNHPGLDKFLRSNPGFASQVKSNPGQFLRGGHRPNPPMKRGPKAIPRQNRRNERKRAG